MQFLRVQHTQLLRSRPLNPARGRASREGLQLGFAAVDENEIRRGVRELALALESESRRRAR